MNAPEQNDERFYSDLPTLALPPAEVVAHRQYFHFLPADWHIVIADIKDSTGALRRGQYQAVNLLGSACVVAGLNLAREQGIEIPFVYGGDGASLAVPPTIISPLLNALAGLRRLANDVFKLELRVGALTIGAIEKAGYFLKVAKVLVAPGYHQALFLDSGLYYAEQLIKDNPAYQSSLPAPAAHPNLNGLRCRWSDIAAPAGTTEIICLIVHVLNPAEHDRVYCEILGEIERIYGDFSSRHPLQQQKLDYTLRLKPLLLESYARFGRLKPGYVFRQFLNIIRSKLANKRYGPDKKRIITGTDVLKIDGSLKTIIAGDGKKRQELLNFLRGREAAGELNFGHWVTAATFLTCFVPQTSEYINFLDGQGGGYTMAASDLKRKLLLQYS